MIKAVLGTNVLISALFWKGAPHKVVQKGLSGVFVPVISLDILEEISDKLINKFHFPAAEASDFIRIIAINFCIVKPMIKVNAVKKDFSDNKIIECVLVGETDCIVSGDKHLLEIKKYGTIKIVSPQEFLKFV